MSAKKPEKRAKPKTEKPKTFTPQTEWIKTRLKDRGLSLERVADALDTYKLMVHRVLSGSRPVRPEELLLFSRLLNLSIAETCRRFGYSVPDHRLDLIGRVNSDGRVIFFAPEDCRKVDAPSDAATDMRAVIVDAPHSRLSVYDGAILYYVPFTGVDVAAIGRMAIVELAGHPAPVLGILSHVPGNKKRVTLIGGAEMIESPGIISAAPVAWIRNA